VGVACGSGETGVLSAHAMVNMAAINTPWQRRSLIITSGFQPMSHRAVAVKRRTVAKLGRVVNPLLSASLRVFTEPRSTKALIL
jgi:hypothetical protein